MFVFKHVLNHLRQLWGGVDLENESGEAELISQKSGAWQGRLVHRTSEKKFGKRTIWVMFFEKKFDVAETRTFLVLKIRQERQRQFFQVLIRFISYDTTQSSESMWSDDMTVAICDLRTEKERVSRFLELVKTFWSYSHYTKKYSDTCIPLSHNSCSRL